MANTRLVLDVEVRPGNETAAKYTMPGLWEFLERLPRHAWPAFLRGDCAYGNERDMAEAESRGLAFVFKLRQTSKVKRLIEDVFLREDWVEAGKGWEGVESRLRLTGWTTARRVIVLRRRLREKVSDSSSQGPGLEGPEQLGLIQVETEEAYAMNMRCW